MYRTACFVVLALFQVIPRLTTATPIAVCDYPGECGPTVAPVCGSDNKTYANPCSLLRTRCESNTALTVLYDGECTFSRSSRFVSERCNSNCPHDKPVCGTDGQTYSSECVMLLINCKVFEQHVLVKHTGPCT